MTLVNDRSEDTRGIVVRLNERTDGWGVPNDSNTLGRTDEAKLSVCLLAVVSLRNNLRTFINAEVLPEEGDEV